LLGIGRKRRKILDSERLMATKKDVTKEAGAAAPVDVRVVPSGKAVSGAHIEVKTGLTENRKYLITVRPTKGRPVLIAVHL
jgi:hypothetical protein